MLVLSRKKNEQVTLDLRGVDLSKIANRIVTFTIVEQRGDKVRLGIDADKGIPVHRREVFEAIEREHDHPPLKPNAAA
jgi:carbon storage regulator